MHDAAVTFRQTSHQVSCVLDDEIVVLHLNRSVYFGLQGAGVQIWQELAKPSTFTDLREAVMAKFEVTAHECEQDVRAVLEKLQVEGLVEVVT